jgi:hypothetical protein
VSDAALVRLKGLATFWRKLDLERTQVTDAALAHLKGLATIIQILDLSGTQVTDTGLGHLKALAHLTEVALDDTMVTDQGIADLKKTLTNLRITHKVTRVGPRFHHGKSVNNMMHVLIGPDCSSVDGEMVKSGG